MSVLWLTAFLDLADADFDAGTTFWAAATDSTLSPARGEHDEFATLVPAAGDAYLKVQRVGGQSGVHLDLHVADPVAFAWRAVTLGATELTRCEGLTVLSSPGGFVFCVVEGESGTRPQRAPGIVDQVCLDVNVSVEAAEVAFWASLLQQAQAVSRTAGMTVLTRPDSLPLRLVLQRRVDERQPAVTAHLDLAGGDASEVVIAHHEELGARKLRAAEHWVTLRDPAGLEHCVTRRDPVSGLLPG